MQDVIAELDKLRSYCHGELQGETLMHWRMSVLSLFANAFGKESHYYEQFSRLTWRAEDAPDPSSVRFSSPPKQSEADEQVRLMIAHANARREHAGAARALLEAAKAELTRTREARATSASNPPQQAQLRAAAPGISAASGAQEEFLLKEVWTNTRQYIERVCAQVNKCCTYEIWDGAAVLVRRLAETLLIEAYEHLGREAEIRGKDANYLMLGDLVARGTADSGLRLGRDAKKGLAELKDLGDKAAHNRRFNAGRADLNGVRSPLRVVVDELINVADLRREA